MRRLKMKKSSQISAVGIYLHNLDRWNLKTCSKTHKQLLMLHVPNLYFLVQDIRVSE
jgi:hypothetical protein